MKPPGYPSNKNKLPFSPETRYFSNMNRSLAIFLLAVSAVTAAGQIVRRDDRPSLLDSDPEVVYMDQTFTRPVELEIAKEAPVYFDKGGTRRIGFLKEGGKVKLEAITEKIYRVRGDGVKGEVGGWVGPWALASAKDPNLEETLKKFYFRQMDVKALIAARQVAVGMTMDEVGMSLGKPTKTAMRRTSTGESGSWEFIIYEEVKHYITRVDPVTGGVFRQLSHITQEEKSKTTVEFENGLVSAVSESENNGPGNVRIIVPPITFGWW